MSMLDDIEDSDEYVWSVYFTPGSLDDRNNPAMPQDWPHQPALMTILERVGGSETGVAIFASTNRSIAVAPPFPIDTDLVAEGANVAPLRHLLRSEPTVGVVLLRLGRYAVGVVRGDKLIASKTATRHVKNRHRAGGQSQRRFERSRERLIRELYDKTCEIVGDKFSPYRGSMDYVMLGGERHTLDGLIIRCRRLQDLKGKTLHRLLPVDSPNQKALEGIVREVWKSRVYRIEG
ncbi:MAG: Vms1/Ankzf1 family peptidyl-tRNA hydrolase [SAR202 cluster bacterium]|nr:Vms1/Ankzf1 family peptidyl-tRNA hydrolase [SAR202 cluster bacterium]|tara:strand:+ start:1038 stop:1739 length:702 start_codon:yes stop_codon:yes gene_type:complete